MEKIFSELRLAKLNREELLSEILRNKAGGLFQEYDQTQLENMDAQQLRSLILSTPNYRWDLMAQADFIQFQRKQIYDQYLDKLRADWAKRKDQISKFSRERLIEIMNYSPNSHYNPPGIFKGNPPLIDSKTREDLLAHFYKEPRYEIPGEPSQSYGDPDHWVPKMNQVEHIETLIGGLTHPLNDHRLAVDGSTPGKGKTIAGVLTAQGLGVGNILVVAPSTVLKKWHDALSKMVPTYGNDLEYNPASTSGKVRFRLMTYDGLTGNTRSKQNPRPARYKPDPYDISSGKSTQDNDWIQITRIGRKEDKNFFADWSFLPSDVPGAGGIGGTLVIFDEMHQMKNSATAARAKVFLHLLRYIKDLNTGNLGGGQYNGDLNPNKYVRVLGLTGSIIENMKDMNYIMAALGLVDDSSNSAMNAFKQSKLGGNFQNNIPREERRPWHMNVTDENKKLIVYFRAMGRKKKDFSQIPDPVDFILYKTGIIERPYPEDRNDFLSRDFVQNFRDYMAEDYHSSMNDLTTKEKLDEFLRHLSKKPEFRDMHIERYINPFKNTLTFQPLRLDEKDLEDFKKLNQDITRMLQDMENKVKKGSGILGQIQTALTQLEVYKIVPFIQLAKTALGLVLENGAQPSMVIALLRLNTVRSMAWSLEAYMQVRDAVKHWTPEQIEQYRHYAVATILQKQADYQLEKEKLLRLGKPLHVKSTFDTRTQDDLYGMTFEELQTEFNKWVIYLNVNMFTYVSIYTGNFGVSKDKNDLDFESDDIYDHVCESVTLSDTQKEEAREFFQVNRHKIIITTMSMGSLGIDLMDVSEGGMNPRAMLMSPGINAKDLMQMRKRIVREGQTSDTFTLVGFVGDFGNVPSWEAKLMDKVSKKVKNIQLLHDGEVSMDVEAESVDPDETLFKMMKKIYARGEMNSGKEDDQGRELEEIEKILKDALEGKSKDVDLEKRFARTTAYMAEAKVIPGKKSSISMTNAIDISSSIFKVEILYGDSYAGVIVDDSVSDFNSDSISSALLEIFEKYKFRPDYYMIANFFYPAKAFRRGVLIFREHFKVIGLENSDFTQLCQTKFPLDIRVAGVDVNDKDFVLTSPMGDVSFNPSLKVEVFAILFNSKDSMTIAPSYHILSKISRELIGNDLKHSPFKGELFMGTTFEGEPVKMAAIYYAVLVAYKEYEGTLFDRYVLDSSKERQSIQQEFYFKVSTEGNKNYWKAPQALFNLSFLILNGSSALKTAISNQTLFDSSTITYDQTTGMGSILIMPDFVEILKRLVKEFER